MDDLALAGAFCTYENYSLSQEDFPKNDDPVFILGHGYSSIYDYDNLKLDILSRVWITYRKGFSAIGGLGPTCDQGWGCMLRCGQMMLCQALVYLHLGPDWRWHRHSAETNSTYRQILCMFADHKSSCYSIHQIAAMGAAEGKEIGQWFGPNTIAQVLRKLSAYDSWNNILIHVAMDNTVVTEDIRTLCKTPQTSSGVTLKLDGSSELSSHSPLSSLVADAAEMWRPLVLIIPLRLGLSTINDVYAKSLKRCFELPYSIGVIGGKPNHAHWFIGYVGDELVFLDPHTTQQVVDSTQAAYDDASYHTPCAGRMKLMNLDPSLAVGFVCKTEADFSNLCHELQKENRCMTPMFEIHNRRPSHLPPPSVPNTKGTGTGFTVVPEPQFDTDDEYELV